MPVTKEGFYVRFGDPSTQRGRNEFSVFEAWPPHIRTLSTGSLKGRELAQRPLDSLTTGEVVELVHQVTIDLSLLEIVNPQARESLVLQEEVGWTEKKREEVARIMFASVTDERLDYLNWDIGQRFLRASVDESNVLGLALALVRAEERRREEQRKIGQ